MAFSISLETRITINDGLGDDSDAVPRKVLTKTISNLEDVKHWQKEINNTTAIVWDATATGENPTTFDFLALWADGTIDVEMTINEGDAAEELISFTLGSNTPLVLTSDVAYYNHSASDVWGGTADVIDKIRVQEPNTTDVNVYAIIASV